MHSFTLNYILYDGYMNILKQGLRLTRSISYDQARKDIEQELIYQYPDVAWIKVK